MGEFKAEWSVKKLPPHQWYLPIRWWQVWRWWLIFKPSYRECRKDQMNLERTMMDIMRQRIELDEKEDGG